LEFREGIAQFAPNSKLETPKLVIEAGAIGLVLRGTLGSRRPRDSRLDPQAVRDE
jgi:hypothetical protein